MGEFDPVNNIQHKAVLVDAVESVFREYMKEAERRAGTLKLGEKEYKFFGFGPWVQVWVDWHEREMRKIRDRVQGFSKAERWNDVATLIMEFRDKTARGEKPAADEYLTKMYDTMEKPDKEPEDPAMLEGEMKRIYGTLNKSVLKKLMPDAKIDDDQAAIVFDSLMKHVLTKTAEALNFLESSTDWALIAYEVGQKGQESSPAKSSA